MEILPTTHVKSPIFTTDSSILQLGGIFIVFIKFSTKVYYSDMESPSLYIPE